MKTNGSFAHLTLSAALVATACAAECPDPMVRIQNRCFEQDAALDDEMRDAAADGDIRTDAGSDIGPSSDAGVPSAPPKYPDYDGDGRADQAAYLESSAGSTYLVAESSGHDVCTPPFQRVPSPTDIFGCRTQFGTAGEVPVVGDFDGDGITDVASFHPSTLRWRFHPSAHTGCPFPFEGVETCSFSMQPVTDSAPIPTVADYDRDGRSDPVFWDGATESYFHLVLSSGSPCNRFGLEGTGTACRQRWGNAGYIPMVFDHNGDGQPQWVVWDPVHGVWHLRQSDGSDLQIALGLAGDFPVPGNYDGVGGMEVAVWRAGVWFTGEWGVAVFQERYGLAGDLPVPGPYHGAGRWERSVWRPDEGGRTLWYLQENEPARDAGDPTLRPIQLWTHIHH